MMGAPISPSELARLAPDSSDQRGQRGIVLAIVLVLIFVLITAVYAFQRRAIIDTSITKNRLRTAEADVLARGGLRIAEAIVFVIRLKEQSASPGPDAAAGSGPRIGLGASQLAPDQLWSRMGNYPLDLDGGRTLRISIEDEAARLNLNALVPQASESGEGDQPIALGSGEEAEEYLVQVLDHIVAGIEGAAEDRNYDTRAIAQNLLDYMDPDDTARNGRAEDSYYQGQDPPYRARNGPFLSVDEIGLVEGVDPRLLKEMRSYLTVHPIGGSLGINLNRAEPWVLSIVYTGTSGDRELLREQTVRDIWALRRSSKILCDDVGYDESRCVALAEVGNGRLAEGSIYPEMPLPNRVSAYRVVAEATVGGLTRRLEAVIDTRSLEGPQVLSWRRLRGPE